MSCPVSWDFIKDRMGHFQISYNCYHYNSWSQLWSMLPLPPPLIMGQIHFHHCNFYDNIIITILVITVIITIAITVAAPLSHLQYSPSFLHHWHYPSHNRNWSHYCSHHPHHHQLSLKWTVVVIVICAAISTATVTALCTTSIAICATIHTPHCHWDDFQLPSGRLF